MDLTAPTVLDVLDVTPDPRNQSVSQVSVVLSKAIDPLTFTYQDLSLTRGGTPVPLSSAVTVSYVSGNTYAIKGLEGFTVAAGTYVLTVNAAGLKDLAGNNGTGSASDTWVMDTTPPTFLSISLASPSITNSATVAFVLTFSEAVAGVDSTDFVVDASGLSGTSAPVVTGSGSSYTITVGTGSGNGTLALDLVNNGSIHDLAGNVWSGSGGEHAIHH